MASSGGNDGACPKDEQISARVGLFVKNTIQKTDGSIAKAPVRTAAGIRTIRTALTALATFYG
jgi:hypothetical protein